MTNVFVPTDFSVGSIDLVSQVALAVPGKLNIFLFHAFDIPDSLIDALHRVNLNRHHNLITEEIRIKCKQKKALHPNISNISFRPMYGSTTAAFRNFAEANNVDLLVMPERHFFIPTVRESVDYERMFRKSGIKLVLLSSSRDAGSYSSSAIDPIPA